MSQLMTVVKVVAETCAVGKSDERAEVSPMTVAEEPVAHGRATMHHEAEQTDVLAGEASVVRYGVVELLPEIVTAVAEEMLSLLPEVHGLKRGIPQWAWSVASRTEAKSLGPDPLSSVLELEVDGCLLRGLLVLEGTHWLVVLQYLYGGDVLRPDPLGGEAVAPT